MRKNLLNVLMLLSILFAASCQKQEEAATLTLSDSSLEFPKVSAEKSVTVTTNQAEWSVLAPVEWITVTTNKTTVTIKAATNLTPVARKAQVAVLAGGISKTIEITQAGSDFTLVTLPDKLSVDQWGGDYAFDVDANTKDWKVTTSADWVTVVAKQFKSEVAISIAENKGREARTATLVVTAGKVTKEFVVSQAGIMYFYMPYMEFGAKARAIKTFELARKSELEKQPDGLFNTANWDYLTKSPAFDIIRYNVPSDTYKKAIMFAANKKVLTDAAQLAEFKAFLKSNGFDAKDATTFFNSKTGIEASIMAAAADPYVLFQYVPKQDKAYPTFAAFPYGFTDYFKAKKAEVMAWEANNGGTFVAAESVENDPKSETDFLFFNVKKGNLDSRAYFLDNKGATPSKLLIAHAHYFTEMTLCLWEFKGEFLVTNEFKALAEKEGFKYKGFNNNSKRFTFENAAKKLVVAFRWVKYSDMPIPVIDFQQVAIQDPADAAAFYPTYSRKDASDKATEVSSKSFARLSK